MRISRKLVVAVAVGALVAVVQPHQPAFSAPAAQARCFNVPGITDCISSATFNAFWSGNGGLPVFGYPVTAERQELNRDTQQVFATQWFERHRFEAHPENQPPYNVLLGRLGAELLAKQGRGFEAIPPGITDQGRCRTFDAAGNEQLVCDPFLRYWETHGIQFDGNAGVSYNESLALFGLPLTYPRMETNQNGDTVRTQWFERARFEDHGSKGVLLGLLARETLATTPSTPVHPVVDVDFGFLLGGTRDTVWLDAATTAAQLRGGESYRLYGLGGFLGQSTGGAPRGIGVGACEATLLIELASKPQTADAIAVGGDWNARPRAPVSMSTELEVYRSAIADILRANGIARPDVRLTGVLRVDLEGDGVDEVLISATRGDFTMPGVKAGDYSLIALRKVVDGRVETIMIEQEYWPEDRDFIVASELTIANLLDLNGDGRIDVVVDRDQYEGAATRVYNVANNEATLVLESCFGS